MKYMLSRKEVIQEVKDYMSANIKSMFDKYLNERNFDYRGSDIIDIELDYVIGDFHDMVHNNTFDYIHDVYVPNLYSNSDADIIDEAQKELISREDALISTQVISKTRAYEKYLLKVFNEVNGTNLEY